MKLTKTLFILPALALAALGTAEEAKAQIKPGRYLLVGAALDEGGFYGTVNIRSAGPVSAKLNTGETFRGRIDRKGNFILTSLSGPGYTRVASGSAIMRSRTYAIGKYRVVGEDSGYFMLGLN